MASQFPSTMTWTARLIATGLALATAAPVAAQPPAAPAPRFALGALVSAAIPNDDNSGSDVGPDFAVNADVGIGERLRIRSEFGRARYTYDGSEGLPFDLPSELVTLTRLSVGVLRKIDALDNSHLGVGVGLYHYQATFSPVPRARRPGAHVNYAMEAPLKGLTLRFEGFIRLIGGPEPTSGDRRFANVPRRTFRDIAIFGGGVGIGWNF